jgi:hypothetical protein
MPQTIQTPFLVGEGGSLAVSTTVLRVLGASSWTGATTNGGTDRIIRVTNCSTALDAFLVMVAVGEGLTGAVSSTDYSIRVGAGQKEDVYVPAGYDLAVVRGSSSTEKVRAREFLYR